MKFAQIEVVGLGPAGLEFLTPNSVNVLREVSEDGAYPERLRLRTTHHPVVQELEPELSRWAGAVEGAGSSGWASFDHLYESEATFEDVYQRIADELIDSAQRWGRVAYIVPGSPLVLERTVQLLQHRFASEPGASPSSPVSLRCHPAMSFLDLVWSRLAVDPVDAGVRLIDGHRFETEAVAQAGPMLVAHCHSRSVLSDIKLAFDVDDSAGSAVLLHHLGLPDERVEEVPFSEIDRTLEADHLTSLFLPGFRTPLGSDLVRLSQVVERLRAECPWDAAQTHVSLRRYVLEEAAEVAEAIDSLDEETGAGFDELAGELGDLLLQVFLHSRIAAEEGWFELADVARAIESKLVQRHPHVFGEASAANAEDVRELWAAAKQSEREANGGRSSMDDLPRALPATLLAAKVLSRAAGVGVGAAEIRRYVDGLDPADFASRALALSVDAAVREVDPEFELKRAVERLMGWVRALEVYASERGMGIEELDSAEIAALAEGWQG